MAKDATKTKKQKGSRSVVTAILALVGIFAAPTAIVIAGGLIPAYAAWMLDRDKGKLMAITVGSLNIAALTPLLIRLWSNGHTRSGATDILTSPLSWMLLLAGSGIGWILAQAIPAIIVMVISGKNKLKLERIKTRQKQLTDEWGPGVTESGH